MFKVTRLNSEVEYFESLKEVSTYFNIKESDNISDIQSALDELAHINDVGDITVEEI